MKKVARDLTVAALAAGATLGAVGLNPAPGSGKLQSTVFSWTGREEKKTPAGSRRAFFDTSTATLEKLEVHASTVNAGEAAHLPHRHPDEEMVIVREGTLEVTINGKVQRAGPGSVIFYGSNDLHGMRNAGDAPATYHVIRWVSAATPKAEETK